MRDAPPAVPASADERFDMDHFMAQMAEKDSIEECLRMTAEDDIVVDNMQGTITVNTAKPIKIMLLSVESGRLVVNAPEAEVDLYLRSVDDLSLVNCRKANVFIGEDFEGCQIYDQKAQTYQAGKEFTSRPLLKILAAESTTVRAMDGFQMMKRKIESKMAARKAQRK